MQHMVFEGNMNLQSIASLYYKNVIESMGVLLGFVPQFFIKDNEASLQWLSSLLSTHSSIPHAFEELLLFSLKNSVVWKQ